MNRRELLKATAAAIVGGPAAAAELLKEPDVYVIGCDVSAGGDGTICYSIVGDPANFDAEIESISLEEFVAQKQHFKFFKSNGYIGFMGPFPASEA